MTLSSSMSITLMPLAYAKGERFGRNGHMSAMSETRKLVAILVSDVVGYSRLAGEK